jgi:threonine/homoserine/homoserine lactone efflux protein
MIEWNFFGTHDYFASLLAAILLNILPGPDSPYILGRSLAQGRMAGICSVLGIGTGCLVHITAAALGLSAVLALYPQALQAISLLGALYLVWLGISPWLLKKTSRPGFIIPETSEDMWVIYRQGFLTNVLNPKVALFFLAFLPSFLDYGSGALSFLFLSFTFFVTGSIWCLILIFFASVFGDVLRQDPTRQKIFSILTSLIFITLGIGILITHL